MEPIDLRITAAQLLTLRDQSDAARSIAALLEVNQMDQMDALQTTQAIQTFLASGDATAAAQLIHDATVRRHPPRKRLRS